MRRCIFSREVRAVPAESELLMAIGVRLRLGAGAMRALGNNMF